MKRIQSILLVWVSLLLVGCSRQLLIPGDSTDPVPSCVQNSSSVPMEPDLPAEKTERMLNPSFQPVITSTVTTETASSQPAAEQSISDPTQDIPEPEQEVKTPKSTLWPTEAPMPTEPAPAKTSFTEPPTKVSVPTEPQPTEPAECTHDWQCVHHDEEGHWLAGIVCDCGWAIYGRPDEVAAAWNTHSASFPPEESLFAHGCYGCADKWVVDTPAYEEWYCILCGETKP